jgi:hypothetical protein
VGNIGDIKRERILIPEAEPGTIAEPAPEPAREPAKVPEREKVPA